MYGKFFVLFAIMFTGYVLRKLKIIDEPMNHGLNKFIVYFAYPCLIVHNIGTLEMDMALLDKFIAMLISSCFFFALYSAYGYVYGKLRHFPKETSNVAEFAMISPNDGFMGFPVAILFFGETGLFLMLAHNAAMNLFFFTYGLALMRRNNEIKQKRNLKALLIGLAKLLLNPNISALVVGMILCLRKISIPEPVDEYFLMVGNVATPMAMIFIGSTLTGTNFLEIVKDRVVVEASLNKLIILPFLTGLLISLINVNPLIKAMLVLGCCFPSAATVSMLAEQEYQDKEMASKILFLSTVLSMATIPLLINLILFVF